MKKYIQFVVFAAFLGITGSICAEKPQDSDFMDAIERNTVFSDSAIRANFARLTSEDQARLQSEAELWLCVHFAQRGFASIQEAVKDEKYAGYRCPNQAICNEVFKAKQDYEKIQRENLDPINVPFVSSDTFLEAVKESNAFIASLQQKYNFSDSDIDGLSEFVTYRLLDQLRLQK